MIKIYLVGGAVRDILLNKEPHDKDYVVIGSTPDEMISLGFKQVGNNFPVFLHPETGDEYALARTERKIGDKHTDFAFSFGPEVTLEMDLRRRDLTVNSLAQDLETGEIIDYFGGQEDLKNKILKHIDDDFALDPLRVLRVCRFASQLNFMIHSDTIILCRQMTKLGMLEHLTPERVWKELEKALYTDKFDLFLHYLQLCNAIQVILPEVSILDEIPENIEYHPEVTTWNHLMLCFKELRKRCQVKDPHERSLINFGVLCHDLGKQLTDKSKWPAHHGHTELGIDVIDKMCDRLKIPNEYRDFGKLACKYHMNFYEFLDMNVKTQYDKINELTKFKDFTNLKLLKGVHICDMFGKARKVSDTKYQNMLSTLTRMDIIFNILKDKGLDDLPKETQEHLSTFSGEQFGKLYRDARISYLKSKLKENNE